MTNFHKGSRSSVRSAVLALTALFACAACSLFEPDTRECEGDQCESAGAGGSSPDAGDE